MADEPSYDYVVVGSGAGGGTVAARLAEAGHRVLVLEAGGDPLQSSGVRLGEDEDTLADDYRVPLFHTMAAENDAMAWDFLVRHYRDEERQRRDATFQEATPAHPEGGILYPRAGALGGCTAHHAMITMCPHPSDWDRIAALTGDGSWNSDAMHRYFTRLEDCRHRPGIYRQLARLGWNFTRHGWDGWLSTERAIPAEMTGRESLAGVIARAAVEALDREGGQAQRMRWARQGQLDPNDWRLVKENAVGLCYLPISTRDHSRLGTRERLLEVAARHPLHLELDALATRVLFDGRRAVGVEYLKGSRLYRAARGASDEPGERRTAHASREVILAGGAFNTPQLLMLSGIGPRAELEEHGIEVLADLRGVGSNLQDRYEVSVVNRMRQNWEMLEGASFRAGDRQYQEWRTRRAGVYATNWVVLAVAKRSVPERPLPDLLLFAIMGSFSGYFPGFSRKFTDEHNVLTWEILKAHTNNNAGTVRLRSANPRDTPRIDFRYFDDGSDTTGEDLESIVSGIEFVRSMTARYGDLIETEMAPGAALRTREELRQYVMDRAWGHHASCSCPMGPDGDPWAVVDSRFRVHGVDNLRIVDASVFPRIPGYFIVSAIYMIAEKAADVILGESRA